MDRQRPLTQDYSQYTAEDRRVWQLLFERQHQLLQAYASTSYLHALDRIGFRPDQIPHFGSVSAQLRTETGWELCVVPGHVAPAAFFSALAMRRFPATCWLRRMDELDYIEEPDMFHDVFGHVPLLTDPAYASFMQAFGAAALRLAHDPEAIETLSRLYWFTIEFGLIEESGKTRIYGAGILSSPGETAHSMSQTPERKAFDIEAVLQTGFRTDVMQELYFTVPSLGSLLPALGQAVTLIGQHRPQTALP